MTFEVPDESSLPRDNGELVFDAPWEARALAVAVALCREHGIEWDEFRHRLMAAIADRPDRPYYESWAAALEDLVVSLGLATSDSLDAATPTERAAL
jgi:nitrile hydratase accessory protein